MGLTIAGTVPGAALVAISSTTAPVIEPVQPVAGDKPAPDRGIDAHARRAGGSVAAALLLQHGGTPTAGLAPEPAATASKPNLDALNRVLAHYLVQSQAAARLGR